MMVNMYLFGDFERHRDPYLLEMKYPLFSWLMFTWDINHNPFLSEGYLTEPPSDIWRFPENIGTPNYHPFSIGIFHLQ